MADIRLVATDLDGTLIGSANDFPLYVDFRNRINDLRRNNGTVWVVCTGRSLSSFRAFFSPMRAMGIAPDFIVIGNAYVYGLTRFGYVPSLFWNVRIFFLIREDRRYSRDALVQWHTLLTGGSRGIRTVIKDRDRMRLHFESELSALQAVEMLKEKVKPFKHFQVFRHQSEVEVHSVPFTKGLAILELMRYMGIASQQVLTIGNGYNDISMLNGSVAGLTGCPSNSEAEVMEAVHHSGGHIAGERSLGGVIEVLDAHLMDSVRSELPDWWKAPSLRGGAMPEDILRARKGKRRYARKCLIAATLYTVLMAFASFDLIPLSGLIMKPYRLLMVLLERFLVLISI